jgi:hypothetical protein
VRFATFNASLNRSVEGELVEDLSTTDDEQAANVAETIQRIRPDVLLINEFDYDARGKALQLFQKNYLSESHNGSGRSGTRTGSRRRPTPGSRPAST